MGRDDRDVWLQAAYSPVLDPDGRPWKVIKYALDITAEKKRTAEFEGKVAAIDRSQAVIEFGLDGTVLTANDNFLTIVGYDLDEVVGQQHRMFLAEGEDTVATRSSGGGCAGASSSPASSGGAPRPAWTCGCGRPTTR